MSHSDSIQSPTRRLDPDFVTMLRSLKAGEKIEVVQKVRVGAKVWFSNTVGTYRSINYLATGVTTERLAQDDIVVPMLHFTKENGELASIAIDENTKVTRKD